jgi:hypothetical protein
MPFGKRNQAPGKYFTAMQLTAVQHAHYIHTQYNAIAKGMASSVGPDSRCFNAGTIHVVSLLQQQHGCS